VPGPNPPDSFLPLKPNFFHILVTLASGEQHGYAIMQEVLERTRGKVRLWPASLYGTLRQLLEAGLIEEFARRSTADDDPRRRYYRITSLGRKVLAAESARLRQLVKFLDRIQEA